MEKPIDAEKMHDEIPLRSGNRINRYVKDFTAAPHYIYERKHKLD